MNLQKFWSSTEILISKRSGTQVPSQIYGWSNESMADARTCAQKRAANVNPHSKSSSLNKWYYDRPLRETILSEHSSDDVKTLITRSRYGAQILVSDKVAFIDIDVFGEHDPQKGGAKRYSFFDKLLGRPSPTEEKIITLKEWFSQNPRVGMRLYKTPNGYRGIFTHALLDPQEKETERLFEAIGSDPLYKRLCRQQNCFRARLTAKPWRINVKQPHIVYPVLEHNENSLAIELAEKNQTLLKLYENEANNFAACSFIEHLGHRSVLREVSRVVELHDEKSGALSNKPIA